MSSNRGPHASGSTRFANGFSVESASAGRAPRISKRFFTCLLAALCVAPLTAHSQLSNSPSTGRAISGRIVFAQSNRPAEGIRVELRAFGGATIQTVFVWNGAFEIGHLPAGTYVLVVEDPCCQPLQQVVDLSFGGTSHVRLMLEPVRGSSAVPGGTVVSVRELRIPGKARDAFQEGLALLTKNPAESLPRFKQAIAAYADYYEAYYRMGVAHLELNQFAEAELAFSKSIELSAGRYVEPQLALGLLFCKREQYAEAVRVLRQAHQLNAKSWMGHYLLGAALMNLNRPDEAEKSAREALERNPKHAGSYLLLAYIQVGRREYPAAMASLDACLALASQDSTRKTASELRILVEGKLAVAPSDSVAAAREP